MKWEHQERDINDDLKNSREEWKGSSAGRAEGLNEQLGIRRIKGSLVAGANRVNSFLDFVFGIFRTCACLLNVYRGH